MTECETNNDEALCPTQSRLETVPRPNDQKSGSYGQILRASSIIGGAQGFDFILGIARTKLIAILLGPSGVGLVGLYQSATGLVATLTGLGVGASGVREVAKAHGSGDDKRVAQIVGALRRTCCITGVLGWIITAVISRPLTLWTFGSGERTAAVALLGCTIFLGSLSAGQTAMLQGVRRIGDLARISVLSATVGTCVALSLYALFREAGIIPVLIALPAINLYFSTRFAGRVGIGDANLTWAETWRHAKELMSLGIAFMWSALLTGAVALFTRSLIIRDLGLDANGVYQAAWTISGLFAGFVLTAMGTDFYPRLTSAANDNATANRLVNEQTEVGVLLALPGLLGTLFFAPTLMRLLYTGRFLLGADLLPMLVLGVFGRVVSWPLGFLQLAKGASRSFIVTETLAQMMHIGFLIALLSRFGLQGVALAYALLYGLYTAVMLWVTRRLSGFRWSQSAVLVLVKAAIIIGVGFAVHQYLPAVTAMVIGTFLTFLSVVISLRGIATRLGSAHRLVVLVSCVPGLRRVCGF